jgi:hypothetical protein
MSEELGRVGLLPPHHGRNRRSYVSDRNHKDEKVLTFRIDGRPPPKSAAKSVLAQGGKYEDRVIALLEAASKEMRRTNFDGFGSAELRLEVDVYTGPGEPPWDAANYLGGISDVLEKKAKRRVAQPGSVDHLGDLADVGLYDDDRQIKEIVYRELPGLRREYVVSLTLLKRPSGKRTARVGSAPPLSESTKTDSRRFVWGPGDVEVIRRNPRTARRQESQVTPDAQRTPVEGREASQVDEPTKMSDHFLDLNERLSTLVHNAQPTFDDLHFANFRNVDDACIKQLTGLAQEGRRRGDQHREHFLKRALYDDGMFWYKLFLAISAAVSCFRHSSGKPLAPQAVEMLAEELVLISEYATTRRHLDIEKRNRAALGNLLLNAYDEGLIRLIREKSRSLGNEGVEDFVVETLNQVAASRKTRPRTRYRATGKNSL